MPKRSVNGDPRHRTKARSQYATDFLPDPWLAQFENEPPGYIKAIPCGKNKIGNLDNLYIKEAVSKTVTKIEEGPVGPVSKEITRTIYVWKRP